MSCDFWNNYISNFEITGCGIGFSCGDHATGNLLQSEIKSCNAQGILLDNSATLDAGTPFSAVGATAYNTVELNNVSTASSINSPTAQVELRDGCKLRIRNHNNIIRYSDNNSHKNDKYIMYSGSGGPISIGFGTSGDDKLDKNYWAAGNSGTTAPHNVDATPGANIQNITFSDISTESGHSGYYSTSPGCINELSGLSCQEGGGGGGDRIKKPIDLAENVADSSSCIVLLDSAFSYSSKFQCQEGYELFKQYFESCAYLKSSYTYFLNVSSMNGCRSQDNTRYEEFRDWLKKVLYYNLDTDYYCADVREMLSTFAWFNDLRGHDRRGALAVLTFLVKENRCPSLTAYYDTLVIPSTWHALYLSWSDTVADPDHSVFDSTLPSLEDLGLAILRAKPSEVKHFNDAVMGPLVFNLYSTPNPFTSETRISFTCRESCALNFEVLDLLGKKVYDGGKHLFSKGSNTIIIPGKGIPNGLLYGRFVLPDGSASTIKLRKIE